MTPPTATAETDQKRNHTIVIWRPCWWCGLPLLDNETDLCAPCTIDLEPMHPRQLHAAGPADQAPLWSYAIPNIDIAAATKAAIEHDIARVETTAAAWARDHDLDPADAGTYRGTARNLALEHLEARAHAEIQAIGWARDKAIQTRSRALLTYGAST